MHKHPHKPKADLSHFYVITVISNPVRYKRRYELYWPFADMCACAGVNLITVEQAFGHRPFMVTEASNPNHVQVRSHEELWLKENMINLGIRRIKQLDPLAREVAWIDADCRSARPASDWFEETWHQLQHHEFVQMWEYMQDLDVNYNPIGNPLPSFMANYIKYGTPNPEEFKKLQDGSNSYPYGSKIFGRPGLAWAANLDALDKVGGILDFSILGAGDWYMAHGLVGSMTVASSEYAGSAYERKLLEWQNKCERWIKRDVGYVSGIVNHDFHGKKKHRGYGTRGKILSENQYDPGTDIKYDSFGLLQLETWEPRHLRLRDQIRAYFRARNEDSIDII